MISAKELSFQTAQKFEKFFQIYNSVSPYIDIDQIFQKKILKEKKWIDQLRKKSFPVAFLGSFSAGKSTIINAILQKEVLPESTRSTTAFPTLIQKGTESHAIVHYFINKREYESLLSRIEKGLKGIEIIFDPKTHGDFINFLKTKKSEVEQLIKEAKINISLAEKIIEDIEILSLNWEIYDRENGYKSDKLIDIRKVQEYTEGFRETHLVEKMEVFVSDISLDSDIILVDLPGLSVANQRHIQFVKSYIQEEAKALVVCMKPNHLLEGDEINFIKDLYNNNYTILDRSFWVINQWDNLNKQQRQEELINLNRKIEKMEIKIANKRFFTFSALNFLLLVYIANDKLHQTIKLKTQISNLEKIGEKISDITPEKARDLLGKDKDVLQFRHFSYYLFEYLNGKAREDFTRDAEKELLKISRMLHGYLESVKAIYADSSDPESDFMSVEINNHSTQFINDIHRNIKEFCKQKRGILYSNFWREEDIKNVINDIEEKIKTINREELNNQLILGTDVQRVLMRRLPDFVDNQVQLSQLLRNHLIDSVNRNFSKDLEKILQDIKNINDSYLPKVVSDKLNDTLSMRDLEMRINGLADSLLYKYGEEIERISSEFKYIEKMEAGSGTKDSEDIDLENDKTESALRKYKEELLKLTKKLVNDSNKYICGSVKNHIEYLDKRLQEIIESQRRIITMSISQSLRKTDALSLEKRKLQTIIRGYKELEEILKLYRDRADLQ